MDSKATWITITVVIGVVAFEKAIPATVTPILGHGIALALELQRFLLRLTPSLLLLFTKPMLRLGDPDLEEVMDDPAPGTSIGLHDGLEPVQGPCLCELLVATNQFDDTCILGKDTRGHT